MITIDNVSRSYAGKLAVDSLSIEIQSGELVVLVGPSGCGKTTTLRMINRLVEPSAGRILIDDVDCATVPPEQLRRGIGYVIQQVGLFPHQTVAANIATVPRLLGWSKSKIAARVEELLDLVGLPPAEFANRRPSELSGGQRQRVGVARGLGADPPILLMDEPFGAIDPVVRMRLQLELLRLQKVVHKTIVFVTHDIDEAVRLGERVALFADGGKLAQYDTPAELLLHPHTGFVEEFLGDNLLLRRLALLPVRGVPLERDRPRPDTEVAVTASLRDALDATLRSADGRVAVVDGEWLGTLDADAIREAAR
ncbi:MAG: ABC transporter ATP-binding protein [Candidatus Dormibacteraeota bacterium]|nr:ABC transporter ATP-binding protein [Candidatus Dormibacteraeota bacterium]